MRRALPAILIFLLLLCQFSHASDALDKARLLCDQWGKAHSAYLQLKQKGVLTNNPDLSYAKQLLELAEASKSDPEAAGESLVYATYADRNGTVGDRALALLALNYPNTPALELLFNGGPHPDDAAAIDFFKVIAENSTNRSYRGQALEILADFQMNKNPDAAEKLYREVIEKYADANSYEDIGKKLGVQAAQGLFYVQHLRIGKPMPVFTGHDVEGRVIVSSDFTSKVLVLCFCSEDCAGCKGLYPFWREMVEKMQGRPFALLEVNPDSKTKLINAIQREKFTWPILWDNAGDDDNSLNKKWDVRGWPNIFLIDAKGIIQAHWEGSPGEKVLSAQIENYVKAAE